MAEYASWPLPSGITCAATPVVHILPSAVGTKGIPGVGAAIVEHCEAVKPSLGQLPAPGIPSR